MFGIRIAKIVFALSLLVSCITFGAGDPEAQLRALKGQPPQVQLQMLNNWEAKGELDPIVADKVDQVNLDVNGGDVSKTYLATEMGQVMDLMEFQQRIQTGKLSNDPVQMAKQIKSSPLYRDPGLREQSNWLSGAAQRLNNIRPDCGNNTHALDRSAAPTVGNWLIDTFYGVLALGLIAFLVFALNKFAWSKRLERRAKALLDEDEPERTVDEWLEMADRLEREGKFREAVRCLYLACLLKLDEARVARFERSQTNWEHLERIEGSPTKPANLEFREATKAFDHIWYGMRVNGSEDVMRFRVWYRHVLDSVRSKAA